ncbi:branched-chain amino acid ABC transporter substrate-binding protein [Salinarimonas soli]|uniref:Branched-chain amino acid ABC transporter substrate-binding protein n=1 Tax=Salinarimonas soli TaxID=1638099 RepID=A0A5B2W0Y5_9HYPH|nr:branched-chain amino acid ABC transporter substrate-binding protein [Salinarimonas soli]KAA2244302.1 branched-chain amino acid ABC transporter substrate-binding protein [Salinarimonas soli]
MKTPALAAAALLLLGLPAAAQAPIRIGVAGPITGPYATTGAYLKNGAELAAEDINAAGGVNGQKIQILVADDVADPRQAVSVANRFVSDAVPIVIGHATSGSTIPASDVYQESGVLQITPSSTSPRYTERGLWNTFRTCGRDDQQGEVAGRYLAKSYKGKRVAILHDKTPYGKGLADETQKTMNAGGLKEVMYDGINPGEKDYSAVVSRLKSAGADIVYYGGLYTEAGLIVRQMRDQGLQAPMMGGDGLATAEFAAIAGPGVEGSLITFAPDPRKNPSAREVVERFRARGYEPESFTLYTYAAVQVVADAMRQTGGAEPKKLADAMRAGKPFKTVIGDLSFDKKGDITRPDFVVYAWKKGADGKIDFAGNEVTE